MEQGTGVGSSEKKEQKAINYLGVRYVKNISPCSFFGGGGWEGGAVGAVGAVASWLTALDSGSSSLGSSPGRRHCVMFLGKTLYSHSASLHPGV